MTYQSARKVEKNNLMFMPIFPVCPLILSIYKKLLKKLRKDLRNSRKVGICIYTNGNSFLVRWDNPNILGKMAILARHFFSQSETPTFNWLISLLVRYLALSTIKAIQINDLTPIKYTFTSKLSHRF